jgi:hypothetical protein
LRLQGLHCNGMQGLDHQTKNKSAWVAQ